MVLLIPIASASAFSNKYTTQERYDSGVRDGNRDCQNGSDTTAYQQSAEYLGHSKYYQQGYDDTVSKCGLVNVNNSSHDNHNQNSYNRDEAQGQTSTQKPFCVTVFGSCNTTSGQSQGLEN